MLRSELLELLDERGIPRNPEVPNIGEVDEELQKKKLEELGTKPGEANTGEVDEELKKKVLDALKEHELKEAQKEKEL